jgi:L-fuconolactonase
MTRTIDAHQHFWQTALQDQPWRQQSHTQLERDFEQADLTPELDSTGIDTTILMQSVDEPAENIRLADYATSPRVAGVVAWLPLQDTEAARQELAALQIPKLVGVRCLIADDPLEWLNSDDSIVLFRAIAARKLVWDVVPITREQTQATLELARTIPELRIVIDHLGRPPVETQGWEPWASNMRALASCPNVAVKVSVGINALTAWNSWDITALSRYVDLIAAEFGADRMMLASNWPVILLRTTYDQAWRDLSQVVFHLFPEEHDRAALLGRTAENWYGLENLAGREHGKER